MKESVQLMDELRRLFDSQRLAVLATQGGGQPYGNLVAFAATDDLKRLLFMTPHDTRKYSNIKSESRVSVLIDSRHNLESDFRDAMAVTAMGTAKEVADAERDPLMAIYLAKHSYLSQFARLPGNVMVEVLVESYVLAKFDSVVRLPLSR